MCIVQLTILVNSHRNLARIRLNLVTTRIECTDGLHSSLVRNIAVSDFIDGPITCSLSPVPRPYILWSQNRRTVDINALELDTYAFEPTMLRCMRSSTLRSRCLLSCSEDKVSMVQSSVVVNKCK
jgi:hypothetical protein